MTYKIPKIPIFPELLGTEKRCQDLQQRIAELDWLEYSFGLAKRVTMEVGEDIIQTPVVYVGVKADSLDVKAWPNDTWKSYAFWDLMEISEFEYNDNRAGRRKYPKIIQPVALIVCLNNKLISQDQDYNVTHSICRNELWEKLNFFSMPSGGVYEIAGVVENLPVEVFDGYDVDDELHEPHSMLRIEGLLTYTQDCTSI